MLMTEAEWKSWLSARPQCVKDLASEFPYGTAINFRDATMHVIGWTEQDEIIMSRFDPYLDFEGSRSAYVVYDAQEIRDARQRH